MVWSVLLYASLLRLDERLAKAAAITVIVAEMMVSDRGRAFVSDDFRNACRHLGILFQPAHPDTATDKPHIERSLGSVAILFAQYVADFKGRSAEMRGKYPKARRPGPSTNSRDFSRSGASPSLPTAGAREPALNCDDS